MYNKHTWLARIGTGLNKFTNSGNAQNLVLTPNPDSVSQAGTPFSASWMNEMEDGIHNANKFLGAVVEEAEAGSDIAANDIIYVNSGTAVKSDALIALSGSDYTFVNNGGNKVCLADAGFVGGFLWCCGNCMRLIAKRDAAVDNDWQARLYPRGGDDGEDYVDSSVAEIVDCCYLDRYNMSYYFAVCYVYQSGGANALGIGLYKADYYDSYNMKPVCRVNVTGEIPISEYVYLRTSTKLIRTYKSGNVVYVVLMRRKPSNGTPIAESFSFDLSGGTGTYYGATEISSNIATAVTGFGVGLSSVSSLSGVELKMLFATSSYVYMKGLYYNTTNNTIEAYEDSDLNKVSVSNRVSRLIFTDISGDDNGIVAVVDNQGNTVCMVVHQNYMYIDAAESGSGYEIDITGVSGIAAAGDIYVVGDTDVAVYDSSFALKKTESGILSSMNSPRTVLSHDNTIVCQTAPGTLQLLDSAKPLAIAANSALEGGTVIAVYDGNIYGNYQKGLSISATNGVSAHAYVPGCLTVSGYWKNQS